MAGGAPGWQERHGTGDPAWGVLNNPKMAGRAFFYFRDPEWSTRQGGVYASEGPGEKARLSTLKDRVRQSGFPVVEDYPDPEALAERVLEDLWRLIDETYPADAVPDALTREQTMHEAYGASRQRLYLGGDEYFKVLDQAIRAEKFSPVLITGQSGGGKSALLANWVTRWRAEHPETAVILHHLGCGADAADPVRLAMRLMQEIARLTGEEFKPESDPEKQMEQLSQWLALGSAWAEREGRELLLVMDGLDKVLDRKDLRWFPSFLPSGVKLVASCLEGAILQAAGPWALPQIAHCPTNQNPARPSSKRQSALPAYGAGGTAGFRGSRSLIIRFSPRPQKRGPVEAPRRRAVELSKLKSSR